jgi:opacity protein-like surface antigen
LASGSSSLNSVGAGISAGFDYRIRNFLIGVEGDGTLANGDGRIAGEKFNNDYFLTVRGRLGAFVRENLIIYGTAGWAGMGMSWRRSDAVVSSSALSVSAIMSGWTVGGGVEYDLPGYVLFAEYLHSDFGSWSFNDFSGNRLTVDANSDVFRIGAKFKVGFDHFPM